MQKITQEQISLMIESHGKWLRGEEGGQRASLVRANLDGANLVGASLVRASLNGANLVGANLNGANLNGVKTDKRYIQVACIGSRKRSTTYCFDDDLVLCGCWNNYKGGSLDEFEDRVKKEHANNPQYLAEYLGFIAYARLLKESAK